MVNIMSKIRKMISSSPILVKKIISNKLDNVKSKKKLNFSKLNNEKISNLIPSIIEDAKSLNSLKTYNFQNIGDEKLVSIVFHCGENVSVGLPIILDWMELTENIKQHCVFVVRTIELYEGLLKKINNRNIVFAKSPIDIENLCSALPELKNICYLSNTANNIHFIRFNLYKHIFVGNFDTNRQPSAHKYFRVYDDVWVHSERVKEQFLKTIDKKHLEIYNVGNPFNQFFNRKILNGETKKFYFVFNKNINLNKSFLSQFIYLCEANKINNFEFVVEDNKGKNLSYLKNILKTNKYNIRFTNGIDVNEKYNAIVCDYESENLLRKLFLYNFPIYCYSPDIEHNYFSDVVKKINNSYYENYYIKFSNINDLIISMNNEPSYFKNNEFKEFIEYDLGISNESHIKFNSYVNSLLPIFQKNSI